MKTLPQNWSGFYYDASYLYEALFGIILKCLCANYKIIIIVRANNPTDLQL